MHTTRAEALYETDFVKWADDQTAALREGRYADLDLPNLTEEIEALAIADRRELRSRYTVLMMHLLELQHQPERATRSWLSTIVEQSVKIVELMAESPSLHGVHSRIIVHSYAAARRLASAETGLPLDQFAEMMTNDFQIVVSRALVGDDYGGEAIVRQAEQARKGRRVRR